MRFGIAALWLVAACDVPSTFTCSTDEQCGVGNRCEPTGFCALPDPGCNSGERYDPSAAGDLSGACVGCTQLYVDADGDGHGDANNPSPECAPRAGVVESHDDCDDHDRYTYPGAPETCDGASNNCMGSVDTCPAGCMPFKGSGKTYVLCVFGKPWNQARVACTALGYYLARVDSATENALVSAEMTSAGLTDAWLGGSDGALEGRWVWLDGTQFWSGGVSGTAVNGLYTDWQNDQPDNNNGVENCLELPPSQNGWNDASCANTYGYACERD